MGQSFDGNCLHDSGNHKLFCDFVADKAQSEISYVGQDAFCGCLVDYGGIVYTVVYSHTEFRNMEPYGNYKVNNSEQTAESFAVYLFGKGNTDLWTRLIR